jgi:O-antigen/teichoic acid export membrane protein
MSSPPTAAAAAPRTTARVARNTLYLTLSQAATIPLAVLVNAITARYLGAEAFGYIYLVGTFSGFGVLAVNWGHEGVLPAMVAQNHELAGSLLGSSFLWRAAMGFVVYPILAAICHFLGYGFEIQEALAIAFVGAVLTSFIAACKDTIRGFERMDVPAYAHVGQQFLWALLVTPVLMLGGQMLSVLHTANVTLIITLAATLPTLRLVGIRRLSIQSSTLKALFLGGTPFVLTGLAMTLQPNIDAIYLSKLGSVEAVGWFAVARRLLGLLLFPATALIGALYPTLARLWLNDREDFSHVTRGALHGVTLLVMPVTLCCLFYPDVAVAIFSKKNFGPAADDLRVLAPYLFMVYFTMPIGTCVLASGKQRAWSIVQSLCVGVSFVLDPLLTPWFERRYKNGGLGPCVATDVSEAIVVACGLALMPRGVFDRRLRRSLALAILAGGALALVAHLLRAVTPFVAAPLALSAYALALWFTGEIDRSHVEKVASFFTRKLSRAR